MGWEEFEQDCFNFLNKNFSRENIKFKLNGSHDSTKSDIECYIDNEFKFFIEVKEKQAQSGQFVLLNNIENNKFEYSSRNKSTINDYSNLILNYINNNYEKYKHASDNGIDVNLPSDIFKHWIVGHYTNKNVKYVMTKNTSSYIIFPLDKYDSYFCISAKLRPKGSGSSSLPKCDVDIISDLISSHYGKCSISLEGTDRFCTLNEGSIPDKSQFTSSINNRRYQFNKISDNKYKIRKLSNTRNCTLIFSIKLISKQNIHDLDQFKKEFI